MKNALLAGAFCAAFTMFSAMSVASDVLSSWAYTGNRAAITTFVEAVLTEGSDSYLPSDQRVAVFDNDGTLWTEKPTYTEVIFALEQVKALAPNHPEWQDQEPFSIILDKGLGSLKVIGLKGAITALTAVYAELDNDEFNARVVDFLARPHLKAGRANIETTYAPMVDLINYLRGNDFRIYIVTGGTNAFVRTFSGDAYGVPTHQIVGAALAAEVVEQDGGVTIQKLPKLAYFNDGETKVLNIARTIGTRPVIVAGNSDGDLPMIRYALEGNGPRLGLLLRHDDDVREAAYDRGAGEAIASATPEGDNFLLVSMKSDFTYIWAP